MDAEKPLSTGGPEDRGSITVSIAEGSSGWGFPAGLCLIEEHPAGEACRLHSAAAGEGSRIFPLQGGGGYDPQLVFPLSCPAAQIEAVGRHDLLACAFPVYKDFHAFGRACDDQGAESAGPGEGGAVADIAGEGRGRLREAVGERNRNFTAEDRVVDGPAPASLEELQLMRLCGGAEIRPGRASGSSKRTMRLFLDSRVNFSRVCPPQGAASAGSSRFSQALLDITGGQRELC